MFQHKQELDNGSPVFSIITATYNAQQYLQECLDSVSKQCYPAVNHTLIDGFSVDGTVEIINKHGGLHYYHSRQDQGIADAFNQGLKHSRGNVILFLGADDYFVDPEVLADAALFLQSIPRPWFIYGDVLYRYDGTKRLVQKNYSWSRFRKYNCLPHQALFVDRWFFEQYGIFDLSYKIAMDYEHIARFIHDFQPEYWPRTVAEMRRSGVSSDPLPTHSEMDRVKKVHKLAGPVSRYLFLKSILVMFFIKRYLFRQQWS